MSTLKIHGRQVNSDACPVVEASKIVGDFWNIWIIRTLLNGPKKFLELEKCISTINKATLNNKLKTLIETGMVEKSLNEFLKPQYQLTKKGKGIESVILELEKYGRKNFS